MREVLKEKNRPIKFCNTCKKEQPHYLSTWRNKTTRQCKTCSLNRSRRRRRMNWVAVVCDKANSRKRGDSEIITVEMVERIWANQGYVCALTGVALDTEDPWWKPSLDRIDSSIGYVEGNLQVVAWVVNKCKLDLSVSLFRKVCILIAGRNN